jgi:hypothetical protein
MEILYKNFTEEYLNEILILGYFCYTRIGFALTASVGFLNLELSLRRKYVLSETQVFVALCIMLNFSPIARWSVRSKLNQIELNFTQIEHNKKY